MDVMLGSHKGDVMNSRVKIVKRGTLELPQRSEFNPKNAKVSSDRETAVIIKGWIADHDQRRRVRETWHWETLIKLGR
jgi:hypothetical protein